MIICYPVIIEKNDGIYNGYFYDFEDVKVKGKTLEDILTKAKEKLGVYLLENENAKEPSDPDEVDFKKGQLALYIDVNMDWVREKKKYKSISRMVTVPKWLNERAKESGINVSSILQRALMEALNVKEED